MLVVCWTYGDHGPLSFRLTFLINTWCQWVRYQMWGENYCKFYCRYVELQLEGTTENTSPNLSNYRLENSLFLWAMWVRWELLGFGTFNLRAQVINRIWDKLIRSGLSTWKFWQIRQDHRGRQWLSFRNEGSEGVFSYLPLPEKFILLHFAKKMF